MKDIKTLIHKKSIVISNLIIVISLISGLSTINAQSDTISEVEELEIFNPQDKPFGLSYQEHIKNYWNWYVSIPKEQHPAKDLIGNRCALGQNNISSDVFYLSGNTSNNIERICEVPKDKGLVIPIIVAEMADKEVDPEKYPNPTNETLSKIVKKDQDSVTNMFLKIDDHEYQMNNLSKYRFGNDAFNLNFSENNIFDVPVGSAIAVADGHYIITKPLPPGKHSVYWNSTLECSGYDCIDERFHQEVNYTIIAN